MSLSSQSKKFVAKSNGCPLTKNKIEVLQINLGRKCNLACAHCHVEAGPHRTEELSEEVINKIIQVIETFDQIQTVDLTGGAPEMNAGFKRIVEAARAKNIDVIVRSNLTIYFVEGYEDLPQYFAKQGVRVVASLPCYLEDNVDAMRGSGVFQESIEAIKLLNSFGYGKGIDNEQLKMDNSLSYPSFRNSLKRSDECMSSTPIGDPESRIAEQSEPKTCKSGSRIKPGMTEGLQLDLVYNPAIPKTKRDFSLAPNQSALEKDYKKFLHENFSLTFNNLIAITNLPVGRFQKYLERKNLEEEYLDFLAEAYNSATLPGLMCKNQWSVDYDGYLYDCDFHQIEKVHARGKNGKPLTLDDILEGNSLDIGGNIPVKNFCLGCTAGAGASCGGTLI